MAKSKEVVKQDTPEKARAKLLMKYYEKFSKPARHTLHDRALKIRAVGLEGTKAILACGRFLEDVREQIQSSNLKQGEKTQSFVRWLKLEGIGISVASAYNWMRFYDYANRFGTGIVQRLGIKMLTGTSGKDVAQRLISAGELTPSQEKNLAEEIKREGKSKKAVKVEKKKLLTKSVKAVFSEAKKSIRTVVTNRIQDATAQERAVVLFVRDLLKGMGITQMVVVNKKDLPTE